jgi:hypothetical protein
MPTVTLWSWTLHRTVPTHRTTTVRRHDACWFHTTELLTGPGDMFQDGNKWISISKIHSHLRSWSMRERQEGAPVSSVRKWLNAHQIQRNYDNAEMRRGGCTMVGIRQPQGWTGLLSVDGDEKWSSWLALCLLCHKCLRCVRGCCCPCRTGAGWALLSTSRPGLNGIRERWQRQGPHGAPGMTRLDNPGVRLSMWGGERETKGWVSWQGGPHCFLCNTVFDAVGSYSDE